MQGAVSVATLTGDAWIKDENGELHQIGVGDVIQPGETIVTAGDASLVVVDARGVAHEVPAGSDILLPSERRDDAEASEDDTDVRDEAALSDDDPVTPLAEWPADDVGAEPQSEGVHSAMATEGSSFTILDRIQLELDPLDYDYAYARSDDLEWRKGGAFETEDGSASALGSPRPTVEISLLGAGDDGVFPSRRRAR